jgi:hypothetical protein
VGAAEPVTLGAAIIGGGPAGAGLLLAARGSGQLDALLDLPARIVERDTGAVGLGALGRYWINSDSHAESFLRAIESAGEPVLTGALDSAAGRAVLACRGAPVALPDAAAFVSAACQELRAALAAEGRDPMLTGLEAMSARRASTRWRLRCRRLPGGEDITLEADSLVLATGARQVNERLEREPVAGGAPLLPRFAGKVMQSDVLLTRAGTAAAILRLQGLAAPQVAVVGGSHSALACAQLLLDATPRIRFGEAGVTVLHRRPLRLTYQTPAAALAEGYADFGPDDVCSKTGRVYPLGGFRSDARDLLRRAWGLGGDGPEQRLRLHRLAPGADANAERVLAEADLIVAAFGYRPRALPLFRAGGTRIALHAESADDAPLVDGRSRVLAADGTAVPGVFGIGIAAGFPLSGTHGERSFRGQANGLALWHGEIGAAIVSALLAAD